MMNQEGEYRPEITEQLGRALLQAQQFHCAFAAHLTTCSFPDLPASDSWSIVQTMLCTAPVQHTLLICQGPTEGSLPPMQLCCSPA